MPQAGSTIIGARGLVGGRLRALIESRGKSPWCPSREQEDELYQRPLGTVYYCAGLTADYRARPFDTVEAHVSLLARMLERADFSRLVYLSSTRLYDSLGSALGSENAMLQFSPSDPRHLYDLSKSLGENLCLTASAGRACVARLSCVLGDSLQDDGFIPSLLSQARGQVELEVSSSPFFARDYIGLDDVAGLLVNIAEQGKEAVYNVASGINVSNSEVFRLVEKITGCVICPTLDTCANAPQVDIKRIQGEFGFVPVPLETLMKQMVNKEVAACS